MSKAGFLLMGLLMLPLHGTAPAQAPNGKLIEQQAKAMAALSFLDGEWAGPAVAYEANGPIRMTQTERSGTLLGGTIRLIEGKSFDAAGKPVFNAFATIFYDVQRAAYSITAHANGHVITTELKLSPTGFEWDVPAGLGAKMHFTAVIKNGTWTEVGEYITNGRQPKRTFEMTVLRLRPSKWPVAERVKP